MSTEKEIGHVLVVRDFLTSDELLQMREVFEREVRGDPNGKVEVSSSQFNNRAEAKILTKTLRKIRHCSSVKYGREVYLDKIWYQSTSSSSPKEFPNSSPFFPHMDTARYFKGMLYLSDVTENHGPFTSSTLNPDDFEATRHQLIKFLRHAKSSEMDFFLQEFSHFSEADFSPITATAGSLVVFDTNTPHLAGTPRGDNTRQVVRFDLSRVGWQPGAVRKLRFLKVSVNRI